MPSFRLSSARLLVGLLLASAAACATPSAPPSVPTATAPAEYWPARTNEGHLAALGDACTRSRADQKPVLLVFSAPWCSDCRALKSTETHPLARAELSEWHRVTVRMDDGDPTALPEAFGVRRIPTLVALRPTDCDVPVTEWPRLAETPMEGLGRQEQPEVRLVTWLRTARSP